MLRRYDHSFFILGVRSIVSSLCRPPLVNNTDIISAALWGISGGPVNELPNALHGRIESTLVNKSARSTPSMFSSHRRSYAPPTQHKEVASKEETRADGRSCKGDSPVSAGSQRLDFGGLSEGGQQRRVQCGAGAGRV